MKAGSCGIWWMVCLVAVFPEGLRADAFRRGDANASGVVDAADPVRTLEELFLGGDPVACADAADADDDGEVALNDAIQTLNYLYVGTAELAPPGPETCGTDPTPDALGCGSSRSCAPPSWFDDAEPACGRMFAGPLPPLPGQEPCTGSRPPSRDEPRRREGAPEIGADRVPLPDADLPRTSVAWHGGRSGLPVGPTAEDSAPTSPPPVVPVEVATDLYHHPGDAGTTLEFLASLEHGAVEVGRLGLVWGEQDRSYVGVTEDVRLVVGRRYFSRDAARAVGSLGPGWVHSFDERLVFVAPDRVRHVSWESAYDDAGLDFVRESDEVFRGPDGVDAVVVVGAVSATGTRSAPGAYELRWADRVHVFDAQGRITARIGASGRDGVTFFYDDRGTLETVLDSRGRAYAIETEGGRIRRITDPSGSTVEYEFEDGYLVAVRYGAREVTEVVDRSEDGAGLVYRTEHRPTERRFRYDAATRLLRAIENDRGDAVFSVRYMDDSGRVRSVADAYGLWTFDTTDQRTLRVRTPRGFVSEYELDARGQPTALVQYSEGSGAAESRPSSSVPESYRWEFRREEEELSGRILELVEPDGGEYRFDYDAAGRVERMEQRPAPQRGGGAKRLWTWGYDSEGRVVEYVPPEAHERARSWRYAYTLVVRPDTEPSNPGGSVYTVSTPAGGRHDGDVQWVWRMDSYRRLVEYVGPSHGSTGSGDYDRYEYYPAGDGPGAYLVARHKDRRDAPWTEYEYDDSGLLTGITTQIAGRHYTFRQEWNSARQLTRWLAPRRGDQQYELRIGYDGDGRPVLRRFKYYAEPQQETGHAASEWIDDLRLYDTGGNVAIRQRDVEPGRSARVAYRYNVDGALTEVVDPDGKVSRAQYDERGLVWRTWDGYGTVEQVEREFFYNADGDLVRHHEPFGDGYVAVTREYDSFDRLRTVAAKGKLAIEDTFDAGGRVVTRVTRGVVQSTSVEVRREELAYDDWHSGPTRRTLTVYSEDGSEVLRSIDSGADYAPSSRPLALTLEGKPYALIEYTPWGTPAVLRDGRGSREVFEYDFETGYVERHRLEQWDPVEHVTQAYERRFVRDPAGRLLEGSYEAPGEAPSVYRYGYDSLDRVVREVDARGVVTRRRYGYDGRLLTVRRDASADAGDASGVERESTLSLPRVVEKYTYSPGGRVVTAADSRGSTVTFFYDERGRRRREVNADGSFWHWDFARGDLIEAIRTPRGKRFEMAYNDWGLVAARTITGPGGDLLRADRYSWNPLGDLRSVTTTEADVSTTLSFTRDAVGKVLTESHDGRTVTYERDALGRLERLIGPSGRARHYSYDEHQRVREVREDRADGKRIAALRYLGPGRALRELLLGDACRLRVERDGFGRVSRLLTRQSERTAFDFGYGYDALGRMRYEERAHEGGRGDAFLYDRMDHLAHFVRDSVAPSRHANDVLATTSSGESLPFALRRQYHLDPDHHRRSVVTTRFGEAPQEELYWTHPERHHYTRVGEVERRFDLDGKVVVHGARRLRYDAIDRLVEIDDGGATTATYRYDPLGRRSSKTVAGKTTRFVHAGPWLIEEWVEVDGAESVEALHYHATGVDEVVLSKRRDRRDLDRDGDTDELIDLYLHRNRLGSVVGLSLADGRVVERYAYDAFGAPDIFDAQGRRVDAAPSGNRFLFTGREFDAESGYYDYRARTYDPATGTFLQEDPLGLVDGLNPVAYVSANPSHFVDPMGTLGFQQALAGMMAFLKQHRDVLGKAALVFADVLGPLGDLIDLLSAASGYDIRGWIDGGFRDLVELGWWERLKTGAVASVVLAAGAVAIAKVLATFDQIYEKIRRLVSSVKSAGSAPKVGDKIFRSFGGDSRPFGPYVTRTDPRTVADPRSGLALPDGNSARFVLEGRLNDVRGVKVRKAAPLDGHPGGLDELFVPDPQRQIDLERISGVNPEY